VQKAVLNISKSLYALKGDLQATQDAAIAAAKMAEKAAAKKPPKPPDYVMDVVRDDKDKITRIDVRAV
jgi:hypothetical protein